MKHSLITTVTPAAAYVGSCACGRFYSESRGRDRGSVAEMKTAYADHLEATR
jgi:hypothetical protein